MAQGLRLRTGRRGPVGSVRSAGLGDRFPPDDNVVPLHGAGAVDDGPAQIGDRRAGVPDPVVVAVGGDERVLDDVLRGALVVDEEPGQPHERCQWAAYRMAIASSAEVTPTAAPGVRADPRAPGRSSCIVGTLSGRLAADVG